MEAPTFRNLYASFIKKSLFLCEGLNVAYDVKETRAWRRTLLVVYGSLGAVIILMLWFYMTGVTILIGGEVNAIIEQAAARAGDPEAKAAGEKLPDESARVSAAGA